MINDCFQANYVYYTFKTLQEIWKSVNCRLSGRPGLKLKNFWNLIKKLSRNKFLCTVFETPGYPIRYSGLHKIKIDQINDKPR